MTWTYASDFTLPRDQVRFLFGDTNAKDPILSDEEVAYVLTLESNAHLAAAACCDAAVAKYARDVDRSNLGMSAQRSQRIVHFQDLAKRLREQAENGAVPLLSGASESEAAALAGDTDFIPPAFVRGRGDNRA